MDTNRYSEERTATKNLSTRISHNPCLSDGPKPPPAETAAQAMNGPFSIAKPTLQRLSGRCWTQRTELPQARPGVLNGFTSLPVKLKALPSQTTAETGEEDQ